MVAMRALVKTCIACSPILMRLDPWRPDPHDEPETEYLREGSNDRDIREIALSFAWHGQPAQPCLSTGYGGLGRARWHGRRQLLDLARRDVPVSRSPDARRCRSDCNFGVRRDAGGRLHARRRISLFASRCQRPSLCECRRDGRADRSSGLSDRHSIDVAAGAVHAWWVWRSNSSGRATPVH